MGFQSKHKKTRWVSLWKTRAKTITVAFWSVFWSVKWFTSKVWYTRITDDASFPPKGAGGQKGLDMMPVSSFGLHWTSISVDILWHSPQKVRNLWKSMEIFQPHPFDLQFRSVKLCRFESGLPTDLVMRSRSKWRCYKSSWSAVEGNIWAIDDISRMRSALI